MKFPGSCQRQWQRKLKLLIPAYRAMSKDSARRKCHPGDCPKAEELACAGTHKRVGGAVSEAVLGCLRTYNELGGD